MAIAAEDVSPNEVFVAAPAVAAGSVDVMFRGHFTGAAAAATPIAIAVRENVQSAGHTGTPGATTNGPTKATGITGNTAAAIADVSGIGIAITAIIAAVGGMLGRGGLSAFRSMPIRRIIMVTTTCTLPIACANTGRMTRGPTLMSPTAGASDVAGAPTAAEPARSSAAKSAAELQAPN